MIWVTVLTSPARPHYVRDTLRRLDGAGASSFRRQIFVDGPSWKVEPLPGWEVRQCTFNGSPMGSAASSAAVLAAAADEGAEKLLYFEDDVIPCRNAVTAMSKWRIPPDVGFLAFCDIKNLGNARGGPGIIRAPGGPWKRDGDGFWGSQAVVVPRRSLDDIQAIPHHQRPRWRRSLWPYRNASDVQMGLMLASPPGTYGVIFPSLVDHVGDVSAVNPEWRLTHANRRPHNFPGEDFDALTLLT